MTQTIGCTVVGTVDFTQGRISNAEFATILSGAQSLSSVFIYSQGGSGTGTFDFALYDTTTFAATIPRRLYKTAISFPVPTTSGWVEISGFSDDLSALEGQMLSATLSNPVGFTAKTATGATTGGHRNNSFTTLGVSFNKASGTTDQNSFYVITESAGAVDYTIRKGSTATITHTLTAAGLTSAALNGQAVTIGAQSGQTAGISFTDTITTSGAYDLVLGDGVGTQTLTVQYNVIGLTSNTIQKEGSSIGARSDLEMDVLDEVGSTVLGNLTGLTTDAAGDTGAAIVAAGALGDPVRVSGYSAAAGIGFAYKTTLGLL